MVRVREAALGDLESVVGLLRTIQQRHFEVLPRRFREPAGDEPFRSRFLELLDDPKAVLFVMDRGTEVIGFVSATLRTPPSNPLLVSSPHAYVDALMVRPDCRRQGAGRALMAAVDRWAVTHGAGEVLLDVWEFNREAIGVYERLGYRTLIRRMARSVP